MNSLIHSLAIASHGEKTGMQPEGWRPILSFAGVVIHNDLDVFFFSYLSNSAAQRNSGHINCVGVL